MELVKAQWDSVTFGYPVGTLTVSHDTPDALVADALRTAHGFRVVYVFADHPITVAGLVLVDIRETYTLGLPSHPSPLTNLAVPFGKMMSEPIRQLAHWSGKHSRFRIDPHFTNGEFEMLYDRWITASVSREKAEEVLVTEADGQLTGMVTLERADHSTMRIGLTSVHADHQRKGFGTTLMQSAIAYAIARGCQRLTVATQAANSAAVALYLSNGFHLHARRYTYHWWQE